MVIASLGVAFLMMAGEIDISAGYMMSLCSVSAGILMVQAGVPAAVAIAAVLVLGILLSMLNNFLSELLKISRFMITVATMSIFQGISYVISKSVSIKGFPEPFKFLGQGYVGPVPVSYTHLDVYKRQQGDCAKAGRQRHFCLEGRRGKIGRAASNQ